MNIPTIKEVAECILFWIDPEGQPFLIKDEWFDKDREETIIELNKELSNYGLKIYDYEILNDFNGYAAYIWVIDGNKYLQMLPTVQLKDDWKSWYE